MDVTGSTRPAGFWIRAVALAIDLAVFGLVQVSFDVLGRMLLGPVDGQGTHPSVALFTLLFTAVYTTVLLVVAGQTIGKSLTGVRVVTVEGGRLTVGPALLRYLAYFVSLLPLGFGFLVAGLRQDKRALHDLIAGTRVERTIPRPRAWRRRPAPRPPVGTLQDPAVPPAAERGLGP